MSGSTVNGGGTLTVNGNLDWQSGTMSGTGTTVIASGANASISGGGTKTLSRTLNNSGTIAQTASSFQLINGTLVNQSGAIYDIQADVAIVGITGVNTFTNAGTLKKTVGSAISNVTASLNNTGTVQANSGTLMFSGTVTQLSGGTLSGGRGR